MKYSFTILALLMIVGISSAANLNVYNDYYCTATTTYDWTLDKTANVTDLEFNPAPDPVAKSVIFTIDITRSAPYNQTRLIGKVIITNLDVSDAIITSVVDSIRYYHFPTGRWLFVHEAILFSGSYTLSAGATWMIPFNILFTTPYDIISSNHYNFVNVYTNDGSRFQYYDAFHTLPRVVNETLHVWDEYTIPAGFAATPTWTPPYSGTYWTTVNGNATLTLGLSITNQSVTEPGTYEVVNIGSGINECGLWSDTVSIYLHVKPPPDTGWKGYTFTPGYWKNHPEAFVGFLPVTIAGVTVSTRNQALSILNNPNARNAWDSYLCHFLALIFNTRNEPSLLNACYNDKSKSGEFMEGQTVAYIITVGNGYRSTTERATLLAMKDVFDAINNNKTTKVLWLTNGGGSGSTVSLPTSSFITLNPNPFDNITEIRFLTEVKEPVTLSVYDISGTKVRDLVKKANTTLYWDGTDNNGRKLTHGVYIIRANNATLKALISR